MYYNHTKMFPVTETVSERIKYSGARLLIRKLTSLWCWGEKMYCDQTFENSEISQKILMLTTYGYILLHWMKVRSMPRKNSRLFQCITFQFVRVDNIWLWDVNLFKELQDVPKRGTYSLHKIYNFLGFSANWNCDWMKAPSGVLEELA